MPLPKDLDPYTNPRAFYGARAAALSPEASLARIVSAAREFATDEHRT
ncbi:hypothetical protein [Streptomyces sp. NPDC055749]